MQSVPVSHQTVANQWPVSVETIDSLQAVSTVHSQSISMRNQCTAVRSRRAFSARPFCKARSVYSPVFGRHTTPSRLTKTKRAIQSTYASMLVGLAECLPLGILQVCAMCCHDIFVDAQVNMQYRHVCILAGCALLSINRLLHELCTCAPLQTDSALTVFAVH